MGRFGATKVDRCPHVCHHHESRLLGLVEGVHLALQVALLEHQGLAVDLGLSVLGVQTGNLHDIKRGQNREECQTLSKTATTSDACIKVD